jgi:hypothetical protein
MQTPRSKQVTSILPNAVREFDGDGDFDENRSHLHFNYIPYSNWSRDKSVGMATG